MTVTTIDARAATEVPRDVVTLLMADIEGSTQLLDAQEQDYPRVITRARELMDRAVARHGGSGTPAQGDGFFATFADAGGGVRAAIEIQRAFHSESWPGTSALRARIGLHTGQPVVVDSHYYGIDVNRTARISEVAAGGQVLLSASTRSQLADALPEGVTARDLGAYRLKDIRFPEVLFDLLIPGIPEPPPLLLGQSDARPNNLPTPPTTFVGRTRQLAEVRALLLRQDTRLLTLTGAGGTGKTRLALEVARGVLPEFMHGVFFVALAPVADAGLLAATIGQVLGVRQFASRTPMETLTHHLAQREVLLVLDNFEHIVEAATVVQQLVRDCPRLKILVTSREALAVRSERQYVVSPLELPRPGAAIAAVEETESVRLLIDRVRDYDQSFGLTAENAGALCAICARLDGLPLALELAASRLKLHSPQSLRADLQNSLEALGDAPRDMERHQRTLSETIAWSHRLLNAEEQQLFRRLSVFHGGSTPEAAVDVCGEGVSRQDLLRLLTELLNKSLLTRASEDGEIRIGMLELIREFAGTRLRESSEQDRIRERHARHYLELAEAMAPRLVSRDQRRFVTALLNEEDNLRAVLTWALEHRDAALASRLITALLWLWIPRGQFVEGRAWTARALDTFAKEPPCRELALIFEAAGWLQALGGDYGAALPMFERSYEIFTTSADLEDRARSTITLGVSCLVTQDPRGVPLSDEALLLCGSLQNRQMAGLALLSCGAKHQFSGQDVEAASCYEQSLRAFVDADNVFWPGQILQNLAHLRLRAGDWKSAAALAAQALEIGREYDYPIITNLAIATMGAISLTKGAAARAAQFFGVVDASLASMGVTLEPPDQEPMDACMEAARSILGVDEYNKAFDEGRGWTERDVMAAVAALREDSVG
jgi:predicted ATPase/class 3 adenylate cyclase